ncbi:MAG: CAP domain-containing protein [Candidatus Ryanbacteria bacterium]|nr:CAP domain-containing protein [Candidatus Ryanbacteria bacterium]
MKKTFKRYFVPHEANDYKPHFLREASVVSIAAVIAVAFGLSILHSLALTKTGLGAAVLPDALIDLANSDRVLHDAPSLIRSPMLEEAARRKAEDMAKKEYFAHVSPEGVTPWHWFREAGYNFIYAGENLAVNFNDSGEVDQAWMSSPGHRSNILNKNFTEIGIAVARGRYQGRETIFVVELFGRPMPSQIPPIPIGEITEIAQRDMFIAVKGADLVPEELVKPVREFYANWYEALLASPKNTLDAVYLLLAALTALALVFAIFVEIKRQHPLHILYGFCLLGLIGLFTYLSNSLYFLGASII